MDGMFVSNISFGIPVLASIKDAADIVMDVHLMIEEPIRYVEAFHKAGADILNVHYEACEDVQATLDAIHKCGMKAGLTIKAGNTCRRVKNPYLEQAELFLNHVCRTRKMAVSHLFRNPWIRLENCVDY